MYWTSAVLVFVFSIIPYAWRHLSWVDGNQVPAEFLFAILWLLTSLLTMQLGKRGWKRWWPLITLPIALFPLGKTLLIFYLWKTHGLAP